MTAHDHSQAEATGGTVEETPTPFVHNDGQLMPLTARGEATRRRILDAAEAVFGELGYYEASITEITRRAGVAQGTFYIYFHTKRDVFVELVEDLGKSFRQATRTGMEGATDRLEAERRGFAAFFEFAMVHRHIYTIVQEAERFAPEAAQAYYQGISRGYARGLRAAMEAGQIRSMDPEALAYALMGIGHFVALRWIIWPQEGGETTEGAPPLPEEVFNTVIEFMMHGLAKPADEGK